MNLSLLWMVFGALAAGGNTLPLGVDAQMTLTDGSRLVGQLPKDASVNLRYEGVSLRLPWSQVRTAMRTDDDYRIGRLNGDVLTVAVDDDTVAIHTLLGDLTVPVQHIASVKVDPYAAVKVSVPAPTDTLRDGVRAFNDRTYVYGNVPAELRGMQFIRTRGTTPDELTLTVLKPGVIYGAIFDEREHGPQYMQREGWTRTDMSFTYNASGTPTMVVWQRFVEPGDLVLPPIDAEFTRLVVIAPAIDAPIAQRDIAPVPAAKRDEVPELLSILNTGMSEQQVHDILGVNSLPMRLVREVGALDDYTRTYDLGDGRRLQLVFDYSKREDPFHLEGGLFKRGR